MKKVLLLLALVTLGASFSFAGVSKYRVNDVAVEAALSASAAIDVLDLDVKDAMNNGISSQIEKLSSSSEPQPIIAAVLAFPGFGLAAFGIHRVYMGSNPKLILIYFITCGGIFGIVPLIDFIVLVIATGEDDISQFVGNNKFIMW